MQVLPRNRTAPMFDIDSSVVLSRSRNGLKTAVSLNTENPTGVRRWLTGTKQ